MNKLLAATMAVAFAFAVSSPTADRPATAQAPPPEPYRSPYRIAYEWPREELVGDLDRTERGDHRIEAEIPHALWYAERTRERWGAWGPPARSYPPPPGVERWPADRKRERVIAVASRYLGYAYQHHHIPDWEPPAHWRWMQTCAGRNGKGVDCSNFTGFVYNLGFGLRISTDVGIQAEQATAREAGRAVPIRRIALPESFEERIQALRTGDLLFIRNKSGKISHVVLWVGPIGKSPDGVPLVMDSHGEDTRDSEGRLIPCGIHLRPFRKNSWYNMSASHALRIIPDDPPSER
ncbi:C40 family peptidase [Tundrisphaera sp. TA3]|uniref:C40 family peptidase n=1 Tax=Tundrisphaera sp. TA3 TaxID=3435775 RepID=UPI003EBB7844